MPRPFAKPPTVDVGRLKVLTDADAAALDALSVECADFMRLVEGREPRAGDGLAVIRATPPGFPLEDKLVIGLYEADRLVGVVDLLRGYPDPATWYIGLLLLTPEDRGSGIGAKVFNAIRAWVQAQGGAAIRLTVQFENKAGFRFWTRRGFVPIGTAEQDLGTHVNRVHQMELALKR